MSEPGKAKDRNISKKPGEMDLYIGGRLRLWRRTMGVDAYALAGKIGITYQQLQKYEKGMNRISATRLYAISRELNVPIDYFYQGAEPSRSELIGVEGGGVQGIDYRLLASGGSGFLKYYVSIKDPVIRKALLDLMQSIVSEVSSGDPY
jgi:transcriptional regulator with XRE-family HTH domain